ncbi:MULTISPECIES: ATP-dependent DNA helicase [unclassified Bradyrhizobium]|uniref:ATP-dependent helicase n=1 Tax=unclassified Bradyrhizobium TaxID=2631580 RepID=UPI0028E91D28|nr:MULTISPECIES: ATP-dependent DNA helicase [unclassified Bradyrhizobium]
MTPVEIERLLFAGLTDDQKRAVEFRKRRLLVVAGAGSGKTEVMARRIAWWVGARGIPKDDIVAFTFTERAAEEMKFRIRAWIEKITPAGQEVSLGNMYVGTIHGFCIAKIREFWPDEYHNYDILDEASRSALILRGFNGVLALQPLRQALGIGQYATMDSFMQAYDQLHEHNVFKIKLPSDDPPFQLGQEEREWCRQAELLTNVGKSPAAQAFAKAAARYYAYLRCRRFLDFSTSQSEFIRRLTADTEKRRQIEDIGTHLVVDEVQDINPVQRQLIELLTGEAGRLTAVGDHRQAIYGFRGAKVEIIAELWEAFKKASDAGVVDLQENFRSTPRVIDLANQWTETLSPLRTMKTPPMKHGNKNRKDYNKSHVALIGFDNRDDEAAWIADAVRALVPSEQEGALHDKKDGASRGLAFSDIAVLVRSSTSVRDYMRALESAGVPCVVRAGPDLFSQPEILLMMGALGVTSGQEEFIGSEFNPKSMPNRIKEVLACKPQPPEVLKAAAKLLRQSGLSFDREAEDRLLLAAEAIYRRVSEGRSYTAAQVAGLRTPRLREFLTSRNTIRRVFPQQLFHFLLSEAAVDAWDTCEGRGQTAMFHLGALSGLITGIETPGWTSAEDYRWQIIGLCQYGAEEGRVEEQPLMVQPDAVSISTIHSVKGLEFAAVFLADVQPQRFPSSFAKRVPNLPLDGKITRQIDVDGLADNDNNDGERRLMYVALTRAERFLLISHSGTKTSKFIKELRTIVADTGGSVTGDSDKILHDLKYAPKEVRRDLHLATSFSDLRYYLECPHDFYLRKVLGFAPTIDQAFGYGRGVHNLLRAIHSDPKKWAEAAKNRPALEREIQKLIDRGLFYLRYTTADPADNMRKKGLRVVADYVEHYAEELARLNFEPEKAFETLVEYGDGEGGALISGAIDIVRQDKPPRVTLIDFKSGDPDSDNHQKLDEQEMKLQVAIYAVGAKRELEYQPEKGMVRYLDADEEKRELEVPLDDASIAEATALVSATARRIRDRNFATGPQLAADGTPRCPGCDFLGLCGMKQAAAHKKSAGRKR